MLHNEIKFYMLPFSMHVHTPPKEFSTFITSSKCPTSESKVVGV